MAPRAQTLTVHHGRTARVLASVAALFVLGNLSWEILSRQLGMVTDTKLFRLFDLDVENSITAMFAALLLLSAGIMLTVIAIDVRRHKDPHELGWTVLSLGFLSMATDELVGLHEKLINPVRALLGGEDLGVLYFAWVVPAVVLVALLAVLYAKFYLDLPLKIRRTFLLAAALFLGGALGLEMIGGRYAEMWGTAAFRYQLIIIAEEGLEMAGAIVFISGLLRYLGDRIGALTLDFRDDGPATMPDAPEGIPIAATRRPQPR